MIHTIEGNACSSSIRQVNAVLYMLSSYNVKAKYCIIYSFAFGSDAGALASLFSVTEPFELPSPKKMTSTVRSSLDEVRKMVCRSYHEAHTCSAWRKDSVE